MKKKDNSKMNIFFNELEINEKTKFIEKINATNPKIILDEFTKQNDLLVDKNIEEETEKKHEDIEKLFEREKPEKIKFITRISKFFPRKYELITLLTLFLINLTESFSPIKIELLDRPTYLLTFIALSLLCIYSIKRQFALKKDFTYLDKIESPEVAQIVLAPNKSKLKLFQAYSIISIISLILLI